MHQLLVFHLILSVLLPNFTHAGRVASGDLQVPPVPLEVEATNKIYLPIELKQTAKSQTVFGAEVYSFTNTNLDRASTSNLYWIRYPAFNWTSIESVKGTYNWKAVNNTGLVRMANNGFRVVATIRSTPTWAQKFSGVSCGPIAESALPDFYNFIFALVQHYSSAPYNVRYYEFFNEPDVDHSDVPADSAFGCWGDKTDTDYFGGRYYGEMLKVGYQAAKAANPNAQVMIGGLLMDCDPTHPPANGCLSGKFFEGILQDQGGAYFDIVSFHSYLYYNNHQILDEDSPKWIARGGQLTGKVDYLRELMHSALYNIDKPLFVSEIALKYCINCGSPPSTFYELQADAVVNSFARAWGMGLLGQTWYTLEDSGWAYSGLFTGDNPNPAYSALTFMTRELEGAGIGQAITTYEGLRGYEFLLPGKKVWLLWSPYGSTEVSIPSPTGVMMMYDKYGAGTSQIPDTLNISHPIYLEFPQ